MTLFEVLIVVALIALFSSAVLFGSGMLSSNRMNAAAVLIMSATRLGMTRANAVGRPVRLVLDLDQERVILEESSSTVMLREKEDEESSGAGADPANEAERKARSEAERIVDGPRAPRASFKPVKQFGFDTDDPAAGRELGRRERRQGRAHGQAQRRATALERLPRVARRAPGQVLDVEHGVEVVAVPVEVDPARLGLAHCEEPDVALARQGGGARLEAHVDDGGLVRRHRREVLGAGGEPDDPGQGQGALQRFEQGHGQGPPGVARGQELLP